MPEGQEIPPWGVNRPAAYAAGGYEARSAHFRPHVSDKIVEGSKELLNELK